MIVTSNGYFAIAGWEEYQNIEGMERIREQNRIRKQRQREKEKLLPNNSHVTSRDSHATDIDIDKELDKDKEKEKIDYQRIVDMYNDTCVSFPRLKSLSENRKKSIKARLKTYSYDDFKTLFEKAEASDFLKGKNNKDWSATFDWLIKDSNMAKVLDGNYDNRSGTQKIDKPKRKASFQGRNYDFDELEKQIVNK